MKVNPEPLRVESIRTCRYCGRRAPWCSCGAAAYDTPYETANVTCPFCLAFAGEPCIDMRSKWGQTTYGTGSTAVAAPSEGRPIKRMHRERRDEIASR